NSPGAAGDLNPPPDGNYKGNRGSSGSSPDVSGTLTSRGHNLVGNGDGALGISSGSAQDLVGTPDAPYGGIVAPLADNGGPTPTLALMPGSLAIGQGDGTLTGDDQRGPGFPRRVGAAVDIGAFESLFVGPVILGEFIQPPLRSLSTLLSTSELGIQVGMEGFSIQAWLEYGITPAYGARITPPPAGPEVPVRSVAATLIIAPGVLYHYRWVVRDYVDTVYGPDHTISSSGPALVAGDLNGDGIIQESELALVVSNYWVNLPRPQMTNVVGLGETNVSFSVPAPLLVGFEVQSSTNLVDWEYVGPAIPRFEFLDTTAPGVPQRFYRLLSPNPYAAVHVPRP
ncbi:MAG TPA: choice-of-anchor Q domain-containing protein, partial [Myxococcota bacterium]|nr:choice-of-anchor Q domain-containing protein [Myxococcota bacterium]